MNQRTLAQYYAIARLGFGAVLLVAPGLGVKDLVGSTDPRAKLVGRMLAARDVALGAAGFVVLEDASAGRDRLVRKWAATASFADAVDAASILLAYRQLPPFRRAVMLALAAGGAAWGALLFSRLES